MSQEEMTLVVTDQWGTQSSYPIKGESLSIGRTDENDVALKASFVSRNHARIYVQDEGRFLLVDVGSSNGTYFQGQRIKEKLIEPDEPFQIGEYQLHLTAPDAANSQSGLFHISNAQPIEVEQMEMQEGALVKSIQEAGDSRAEPQEKDNPFYVFYRVAERLNGATTMDELLRLIVDIVMEIVPAERAYLLLANEQKDLIPRAKKIRGVRNTTSVETISRTICYSVYSEGKAILSREANIDPRLASESIMNLGINSVLAVPLWDGQNVIGVIYTDSKERSARFDRKDMDLMMAVGFQISQAIIRAQMNQKMKQEEQIRANLERYHSPEVVDMIIGESIREQSLTLQSKEQTATIIFTDIKGFTSLSEKLSPAEVSSFLNEYFTLMNDIIFEFNGTLDKFIGDSVMAVFGTPIPKYDDALRAARTAVKMRDTLNDYKGFSQRGLQIATRIGINTGKVVCGNIGSATRMEYTVLGDAVNLASRLESECEPGRILIGEETCAALEPYFDLETAGSRKVKGKSIPVKTWWLVKERL